MLKGWYSPGPFGGLFLEGDPDSLLELSDLLMRTEERSEVALNPAGVETSSKYVALETLRSEIRNEGLLLVEHQGSTLEFKGPKEKMELLARNVRVLAEGTIREPVRAVQNHLHVDYAMNFWVDKDSERLIIGAVGG